MKTIVLNVDERGRLQIPKDVRSKLGIKQSVKATIEKWIDSREPASNVLERLRSNVRSDFKNLEKSLPSLRKAAEKQLFKENEPL